MDNWWLVLNVIRRCYSGGVKTLLIYVATELNNYILILKLFFSVLATSVNILIIILRDGNFYALRSHLCSCIRAGMNINQAFSKLNDVY